MSRACLLLCVALSTLHVFDARNIDPGDEKWNPNLRDPLRRCIDKERGAPVEEYKEIREREGECAYECLVDKIWYFGLYTKGTPCEGGTCELGICLNETKSEEKPSHKEGARPDEVDGGVPSVAPAGPGDEKNDEEEVTGAPPTKEEEPQATTVTDEGTFEEEV